MFNYISRWTCQAGPLWPGLEVPEDLSAKLVCEESSAALGEGTVDGACPPRSSALSAFQGGEQTSNHSGFLMQEEAGKRWGLSIP